MMILKPVGFFSELEEQAEFETFSGSIFEAVRDRLQPHETKIINYLKRGIGLFDIMEGTDDPVADDGSGVSGGSSLLTDGVWVWRLDLPYLVEKHHLALDGEFISHARSMNYAIPEIPDEVACDLAIEAAREIYHMS
ncbi:hypothetical protein [Amycolatopsis sulphurea]|nr:hypothetical protein [Amycolatopsis sulphurea]